MGFDITKYNIMARFKFEIPPVGVKFFTARPGDIKPLEAKAALCEMIKFAQEGKVFYAGVDDHTCGAGTYILGQTDIKEAFLNGEFGAGLQLFDSPRSGARLYHYIPHIAKGVMRYVAFAPLEKLRFDPDLLLCLGNTEQTEILLRAMSYRTGKMWSSRYSAAIGCAWLIAYPYLSGELNYSITGMGHGMKRRHLFPAGRQFVAIPFDQLPAIVSALEQMPWDLPAYQPDGNAFVKELHDSLGLE